MPPLNDMKYLLVTIIGSLLLGLPAHAAGYLVKGTNTKTVYYLSQDGKRYVFPNDKTYFSWYSDFSSITTIADETLSTWPLAGNVTYKPGKLVKITTDPKVYIVDLDGSLAWVPSEEVAIAIHGNDWAKQVDDIPDAFFINYKQGPTFELEKYDANAFSLVSDFSEVLMK